MGLSYHQNKQYSKAVEWFEQGVSTESGDIYPPTWHFLGWSYFHLGQIQQSKYSFTQHLMVQPDAEDSLFGLGLIAIEEGELIQAKQLFLKSMQHSKHNVLSQAKATARCGDVSAELEDWQDAIMLYEQAVKLNPDLYEAWYRLSRALHRELDKKTHRTKQCNNSFLLDTEFDLSWTLKRGSQNEMVLCTIHTCWMC